MATRSPTIKRRGTGQGSADIIVTVSGLLTGDDMAWFSEPGAVLRSYSVRGTFGAAGNLSVKASGADATDSAFVSGAQADESLIGTAMTVAQTVTGGQYTAAPSYRVVVGGGDGTTNLTAILYFIKD